MIWSVMDVVLHLDQYLTVLLQQYGAWVYLILSIIVFAETGLVVAPFLPGDSLLFVAGAVAALGGLDLPWLMMCLVFAAVMGNQLNYHIGRWLGPRVFQWQNSRFFNRAALHRTHCFYAQHGGKAVLLSRFLPLFRTFVPFVAGVGAMAYLRFSVFNAMGALLWVVSLSLAGFWFGNVPWVRQHLSLVVLGIVILSFVPVLLSGWWHRRSGRIV